MIKDLSDAELLTLLGVSKASEVLSEYGSLNALCASPKGRTSKGHRLDHAIELSNRLRAPTPRKNVTCAADAFAIWELQFRDLQVEHFRVLCLNARHAVLKDALICMGGLTTCSILPREVFAPAIQAGACAIIIGHSHPSGDPLPSNDDLALTGRLKHAGLVLGIKVLDHVVIGDGTFHSMVEAGTFSAL